MNKKHDHYLHEVIAILVLDLKNVTKYKLGALFLAFGLLLYGFVYKKSVAQQKTLVQLALVVDFSNSAKVASDGLLGHYWELYNQFYQKFPNKELQLAVVAFSREDFGKLNSYVEVLTNFDTDAEEAFKHITKKRGGKSTHTNNVVTAIAAAVDKLKWRSNSQQRKIVVVGNGPITSGKLFAKRVYRRADFIGVSIDYLYLLRKQNDKNYGYWSAVAKMHNGNIKTVIPQFFSGFHDRGKSEALQSIINEQELLMGSYMHNSEREMAALDAVAWIDDFALNMSRESFASRIAYKTTPYFQETNMNWDQVGKAIKAQSTRGQTQKISPELAEKVFQRYESISIIQSFYKNWAKVIHEPNMVPAYKYGFSTTIINLLK